jgi:hypothetical protein
VIGPRYGESPGIETVLGPYERWVFSQELGRPFSFPAISTGIGTHFSALLNRPGVPQNTSGLDLRVPPMWSRAPVVTPFAVHDPQAMQVQTVQSQDQMIAGLLAQLGEGPFRVNLPIAVETWPQEYHPDSPPNWDMSGPPPRAIVAVIDDGIPFAHKAFLGKNGQTRLACCWLQSARAVQGGPSPVPFGKEITNTQINAMRARFGTDEPAIYRASGSIDPDLPELGSVHMNHGTHGAHIMGLAAGNSAQTGAVPLPDDVLIIAVQLPNTVAWDTSGFGKEMAMLSAVEYVFHRARALAQHWGVNELPLAVNFSYGWSATGHDGGTAFERAVEHLVTQRRMEQPKTAFVVPVGNHFLDQMHARIMARDFDGGLFDIGWFLPPDDRTSSYLELWFPPNFDPQGWSVTLIGPDGPSTELNVDGSKPVYQDVERGSANIGQMSADTQSHNRRRVIVAMIPTATPPNAQRRTPHGLWSVRIKSGAPMLDRDHSVDIWLQRDDDPAQLATGGRQSRLIEISAPAKTWQNGPGPLPVVRGYGAVNGIGNAPSMTRVAGRIETSQRPAPYSSGQQLVQSDDGKIAPSGAPITVNAISDQGLFVTGLPSIGTLSGCRTRLIGTSAAAATVTRAIVGNWMNGKDMWDGMAPIPDTATPREKARSGGVNIPPVCNVEKPGTN